MQVIIWCTYIQLFSPYEFFVMHWNKLCNSYKLVGCLCLFGASNLGFAPGPKKHRTGPAHVPLFIYPACIMDDCFQFIIQDLGFMLELCSSRSVIMQRCRRKLRLLQFLFVFSFQVFTHCGPVRQWPLTWAFFHWKFLIYILKIASSVNLNHVQYFLMKLQSEFKKIRLV